MSHITRLSVGPLNCGDFTNTSIESLKNIVQPLSIDKLRELIDYVEAQTIPIVQGELQPFFAWRSKQTSIKNNDKIMLEIINQVLNKKECEEKEEQPSPKDEMVTQETDSHDDDQIYVPDCHDNEHWKQWQYQQQMNLTEGAPENTSQFGNSPAATSSTLQSSLQTTTYTQHQSLPTTTPVAQQFGYINNMDAVNAIIKQSIDDLAYLPVPEGYSLAAIPLSTNLPVPSTNNLTSVTQTNLQIPPMSQMSQMSHMSPTSTTNNYDYGAYTFTSAQQQNVPQYNNDNGFDGFDGSLDTKQDDTRFTIDPSPITNQFDSCTFTESVQHQQQQQVAQSEYNDGAQQITESKQDADEYRNNSEYKPNLPSPTLVPRQWTAAQSSPFKAKFNNHAKGNFFISKSLISRMISESYEQFVTNNGENDEKLAFGYYKESVAIQINDGQINIIETEHGTVIIINIDIHFKSTGETMHLIAMENDEEFRDRVKWCIIDFMSAQQIMTKFGLNKHQLPQSSRNMSWYQKGIKKAPINLSDKEINQIVRNTRFKKLPSKTSKRRAQNEQINNVSRINEEDLRYYVEQSLKYNKSRPIHPVVVIKGKNQWIEWKRYIELYDDNGYKQFVGISMRYYESSKQWKIECMDYDAGRVFYQHRLASLRKNHQFNFSFNQLSKYITTTLEIYRRDGWYY